MPIIQTIRVSVLTSRGLHRSESQVLSPELNAEEYVTQFINELGPIKAPPHAIERWTVEVDYHHDNTKESSE